MKAQLHKTINVFIDGSSGTTGLQLRERLELLDWVTIVEIDEMQRKDPAVRRACMKKSKAVFLCLPDDAARDAVSMCQGIHPVIIDASTAHRTNSEWAYGFPELSAEHRANIQTSDRITIPGCHASGFIAIVYPLRQKGILDSSARLSCASLTGYSGGGKRMIVEYQHIHPPLGTFPYALELHHKHLPEMKDVCRLDYPPIFQPAVTQVRQGMLVSVPFGYIGGLLSDLDRALPFVLNIALLLLGILATALFFRDRTARSAGRVGG